MALMNYAFESMNVRRIVAYSNVKNERSWRLLERLGMRREGIHLKMSYKFLVLKVILSGMIFIHTLF